MGVRRFIELRTWIGVALVAFAAFSSARSEAAEHVKTDHLPHYDLNVTLDQVGHRAHIREKITWTNSTKKPLEQLVLNFYPHYRVPAGDYLFLAKTLELLRMDPSQAIDRGGRHGVIGEARLLGTGGKLLDQPALLHYEFDNDNPTTLRFPLPKALAPGESIAVEIGFCLHLPNKQGRWGYWEGVTFITNALPLLAVCDDSGWHPTPFVPWAQPWFNEAGVFTAKFDMPQDEVLACPATVKSEAKLPNGRKLIETEPFLGRDFSFLCSPRYKEFKSEVKLPDGRMLPLRVMAFAEHEHYATEMLKIVADAIPVFSDWFGPFPHSQFTIAESYFGWNGNECSGLVMIDERIFGMPHLGRNYVEYLVSHETCHQWWYDYVGTNGYSEPFVDEGAAVHFTHKMLDQRHGKNSTLFKWPKAMEWMPNVHREDYRFGSMYTAIRNDQMHPAAQDLPNYRSVYGLFTGAYDRGSKVYGMIEDRLGEAAFFDFIRMIVAKYGWKILRAADLKRELEDYTGRDWTEFFDRWVYGKGLTDWELKSVKIEKQDSIFAQIGVAWRGHLGVLGSTRPYQFGRMDATITLRQKREITEATVLGVRFKGDQGFPIRIPIDPAAGTTHVKLPFSISSVPMPAEEVYAKIDPQPDGTILVTFSTQREIEQVAIDPDSILLDTNPGNNVWKSEPKVRFTPLYTTLDETDLTSAQDRWNFTAGPWMWGTAYSDPWYTRSTLIGLRAGANRPQQFQGGGYAAYRTDYRDLVFGVDGRWLWKMQESGFNYERRIGGPFGGQEGAGGPQRAAVYHRWILQQSASMYLSPMMYHETFASYQDNFLPFARTTVPGAVRWDNAWNWGWHFRANFYTPYWDPECGIWFDAQASVGQVRLPGSVDPGSAAVPAAPGSAAVPAASSNWTDAGQFRTELAAVHKLPDWTGPLQHARLAARLVGMGALPDRGQFYALGGGTLFRGYDLAQRQGSSLWVGNLELRVPIVRNVEWDALDHTIGARNAWLAAFYDVGDVYANGREVGGRVAHALGAGVRVDVAIFSFIERATFRFDVAKTINDSTPFQFWFGMQHAF